jgi:cystathionine beta-synthase
MVCGVGSGGTITGLSRHLAKAIPSCEMVLADPEGSVLAGYVREGTIGKAGSWLVEGIGEDFLPPICDLSRVRRAYGIPDRESLDTARALLRRAGILAGSSSGTLLAAALRYAREQVEPKRVCTLVCDSGNKYLSKMFSDDWMSDQGLADRARTGDLRDMVARRHADRAVVTVAPGDTLLVAYARMRMYEVSQLPVMEGSRLVGIIDQSDLLHAAIDDAERLRKQVREVMTTRLRTVAPSAPVQEVVAMIDHGYTPLVMEGESFLGLVTPIDLVNYLRRQLPT